MPFAIIALDKPDSAALRASLRPAHLDYLDKRKNMMLAGGAMLDDAGQPIGGLIVIDTEDARVATAFSVDDPFNQGGLFQDVKVVRWRKSFFNFQNMVSQ